MCRPIADRFNREFRGLEPKVGTNFGYRVLCSVRDRNLARTASEEAFMSGRFMLCTAACLVCTTSVGLAEDYADGAIKSAETSAGEILTDANGMTLYTFDKDTAGTSNCYDECAANWPPLIAAAGATPDEEYTLVERKDGTMQWAYDGKPLYLWKKDAKPGDMTGDGVNDVWHVAIEE
jgi:predicted lipoprotein with Yx(FWY)xxD motif